MFFLSLHNRQRGAASGEKTRKKMIKQRAKSVEIDTSDRVTLLFKKLDVFSTIVDTETHRAEGCFSAAGFDYYFTLFFNAPEGDRQQYTPRFMELRWQDKEGSNHFDVIPIAERKSNLGKGYFYTFVCPRSRKPCRKFLIDGKGYLVSPRYFPRTHYSRQYDTRDKYYYPSSYFSEKEPYKKHGKEYYRGKLTPYGKRVLRHERHVQIMGKQAFLYLFGDKAGEFLQSMLEANMEE